MSYETKNIRNICFMGHGNSGKTSLAESMLFTTGAIDRMGKVTDGNTVCDYDAEEIKRQITIATSVAPVSFGGCKINVLDCPGYFDFVGDVLAAIRVVETGIIFCSAKDGITVGAERSWKYLKAAGVPAMFYISKIDEEHGDYYAVLSALKEKYGAAICPVMIPMSDGSGVIDLVHNTAYQTKGGKTAKVAVPAADADKVEELRMELMEAAAVTEELMEKFLDTMELSDEEIVVGLKAGLAERSVVPVVCGAAMSNIGTEAVLQAVCDYVPAPEDKSADPVCGFVFKTVSDQFGKYSFVKVVSGKITADLSLRNVRASSTDKLGRLYTICGKKTTEVKEACCGDIVAVGNFYHLIAEGHELCREVAERHDLVVGTVYLQAVVVDKDREIIKLVVCGGHGRLPDEAFLKLAVAADGIDLYILAGELCTDSHADGDGDALTERAGRRIYAGALLGVGMPLKDAVQLAEVLQLLTGKEALVRKHRIQRRSRVSLGEDESVPVFPVRVFRIDAHFVIVQARKDLNDRQRAARMTGCGVSRHIYNVPADLSAFDFKFFVSHTAVSLIIMPAVNMAAR